MEEMPNPSVNHFTGHSGRLWKTPGKHYKPARRSVVHRPTEI